ncbi:hypothetical protein OH687_28450 [Burkholderia anthina]|nr:hypothetical protein OH687_28450 [Burkholderia anthina]
MPAVGYATRCFSANRRDGPRSSRMSPTRAASQIAFLAGQRAS